MDPLKLAIERLLIGANINVEQLRQPNGPWFAEQLRAEYKFHQKRVGEVEVVVVSDEKITIDFKQGALRTLGLSDGKWGLLNVVSRKKGGAQGGESADGAQGGESADTANRITNPGEIAAILAQP